MSRNTRCFQTIHRPLGAVVALLLAFGAAGARAAIPGLTCDGAGIGARCELFVHDSLIFEMASDDMVETADGFSVGGEVLVLTPIGALTLAEADLVFESTPDELVPFRLHGTALAPLPELPLFEQATLRAEPRAAVGIVERDRLKAALETADNPLPLTEYVGPDGELEEPAYLFFHFESGLSLDMPLGEMLGLGQTQDGEDPLQLEVPGDMSMTLILDPSDPFFFFSNDGRQFDPEAFAQAGGVAIEPPLELLDSERDALIDGALARLNEAASDPQTGGTSQEEQSIFLEALEKTIEQTLEEERNEQLKDANQWMKDEEERRRKEEEDRRQREAAEQAETGGATEGDSDSSSEGDPTQTDPGGSGADTSADSDETRMQEAAQRYDSHMRKEALKRFAKNYAKNLAKAAVARAREDLAEKYRIDGDRLADLASEAYGPVAEGFISDGLQSPDNALDRYRTSLADDRNPDGTDRSDGSDADASDRSSGQSLPLEEIGFAWHGGIPFEPATTWGLPEDVGGFYGNLYVKATIPLYKVVELTGTVVSYAGADGFEIGGNGEVNVAVDMIPGFLSLEFPLGDASAGLRLLVDEQATYFSGINDPDLSFLPPFIPFVPQQATRVAGYVSSDRPWDSVLTAAGEFGYDTSGLSQLIGVPLNDIVLASVEMRIDSEGVYAKGSSSMSLHPSLATGSELEVEALVAPHAPARSYLSMRGALQVAGVGLNPARVNVGGSGLFVGGTFSTPISTIEVEGNITSGGPELSGLGRVVFPLGAITKAADQARMGVIIAQAEVTRINGLIEDARSIVRYERERDAQRLRDAQDGVSSAQAEVNSLQSRINSEYSRIRTWRRQISSKYSWYRNKPWYAKPAAYASYLAYSAYRTGLISAAYIRIAGYEVAKGLANAALVVAKGLLRGAELAATTIPIDADPRVAGLFGAREGAEEVLAIAEDGLGAIPVIDADIVGEIRARIDAGGISASLGVTFDGQRLTDGRVTFGADPEACINLPGLGQICAPF